MTRPLRNRVARAGHIVVLALACGAWSAAPAVPHELAQSSATLVLRDGGHAELRLQVPWADLLRAQWMPDVAVTEFLARVTAEPTDVFARRVSQLQSRIARDLTVAPDGGAGRPFTQWHWPHPLELREALRRELMSRLATPSDFEHASRMTVVAEQTLGREPSSVRVQLPALLGPALLTVYRPTEQWLPAGTLSAAIPVPRSATRSP